jgi:stage II sporulation protein AA (anti-sigma F factor antagonist)
LQLELNREGAVLTAALIGELDHHAAADLRQKIDTAVLSCRPRRLTIDLARLTFMDSSGIAVVINTLRNMTRIKGKLTLIGIKEQPMRVFAASGIDKLVEIKETVI